jgi:hypothetical protein
MPALLFARFALLAAIAALVAGYVWLDDSASMLIYQ